MDISVISIGNSQGFPLTRTLLEKYNTKDTIELILEQSHMILTPKSAAGSGWEQSFRKMHNNGDDKPLISDAFEDENFEEWS